MIHNKLFVLLNIIICACSCSNNSKNTTYAPYFKNVADMVSAGISQEITFDSFYDGEGNRFNVVFHYDLHFGLALKIEEYDLWNLIFHPNEGYVSDDFESVVFTYSAYEESDLFARGQYVLKHSYKNKKDLFTLTANEKTYSLTKESKEDPHYIDKDLVGEFEYHQNENTLFSMSVSVGSKADCYPVTISLTEGDKNFVGSSITNDGAKTSFNISGTIDGQYIKNVQGAVLSCDSINEIFKLTIDSSNYVLTKTKGIDDPDENSNYFLNNAGSIKICGTDFEATVANATGDGSRVYLVISELVENGNPSFGCWFYVIDDYIQNAQNITNSKNVIFKNHVKYVFTHHIDNNINYVNLFMDDVLEYENLTILNI